MKAIKSILKRSWVYYFLAALRYYVVNWSSRHIPFWYLRRQILHILPGTLVGNDTFIGMRVIFAGYHNRCSVIVGDNCVVNRDTYLDGRDHLTIGSNVNISFGVTILTLQHDHQDPKFPAVGRPVSIGNDVWIGANATILPGADIGRGAVVAAGAVVTKPIGDFAIVAGVPARVIGTRNPEISYLTQFTPYFDTDVFNETTS